jgi:hypothetical protein
MPNAKWETHGLVSDPSLRVIVDIGSADACPDYLEQYICRMLQRWVGLFHDFDFSNSCKYHGFHKSASCWENPDGVFSRLCVAKKSVARRFVHLESKNLREVEAMKRPENLSGRERVHLSATASNIDPCKLEKSCNTAETYSSSLAVISMMQSTNTGE